MQIKNQINISQCTFFRRLLNRLSRLARGSADFCVSLSANYAHSFSSIYRSLMCDFFETISTRAFTGFQNKKNRLFHI